MKALLRAGGIFALSVLILMAGTVGYILISLPEVTPLTRKIPFPTALMRHRQETARLQKKRYRLFAHYIPIRTIPEELQRCVILGEDAAFWVHGGIDWYEIRKSFWGNLKKGKIVRGGSTITQQVAKNLYLSEKRTLYRKLQEYFLARRLEQTLSKKRILEIYLNIIELGPGLFGVDRASRYYFGKSVSQLSLPQMIELTATIPSPLKDNPFRKTRRFLWRCGIITRRLHAYKVITDSVYTQLKVQFAYR